MPSIPGSPQTLCIHINSHFFYSKLCVLVFSVFWLTSKSFFSPVRETLNYLAHLHSHEWSCVVFGPWITGRLLTSQQSPSRWHGQVGAVLRSFSCRDLGASWQMSGEAALRKTDVGSKIIFKVCKLFFILCTTWRRRKDTAKPYINSLELLLHWWVTATYLHYDAQAWTLGMIWSRDVMRC